MRAEYAPVMMLTNDMVISYAKKRFGERIICCRTMRRVKPNTRIIWSHEGRDGVRMVKMVT